MSDVATALSRTLVDEWARAGVVIAAISPGSRSTPLALALATDDRIVVHVFLDERSASFFALGVGKATGRPAVLLCTSGTAAAEFHPAVLEAFHARVPMVVCTADRPPELRDTGAGQAVDQMKLYGAAVRWFAEIGVPHESDVGSTYWRSVGARAVVAAGGPPAGPVHLNVAFREPLLPTGADVVLPPARADGAPWVISTAQRARPHPDDVDRLALLVAATTRGIVIAGWGADVDPASVERFAAMAAWPVLADPISGVRQGPNAMSTYDALLRSPAAADGLRPDLVLRLGAPLTSKSVTSWLDPSVSQVVVDPDSAWLDPLRTSTERIVADPSALLDAVSLRGQGRPPSFWMSSWRQAETAARAGMDRLLDGWPELFEGRVARDLVAGLPDGATLVVGSSMPVRDVETFARPRSGLRFLSNRGVNGIDGFVSTVLGVAAASSVSPAEPGGGVVVALCGDLTFLHDAGGLLRAARRGLDATFVVIDNDGGGIFSFLPQGRSGAETAEQFETLFATPQGVDLAQLAAVHGVGTERVGSAEELMPAVRRSLDAGGVRLVIVPTDRAKNVDRHRQVWETVSIPGGAPSR